MFDDCCNRNRFELIIFKQKIKEDSNLYFNIYNLSIITQIILGTPFGTLTL